MRDFEPKVKQDTEISVSHQQYNLQHKFRIRRYPGQTVFRINKTTHEVEEIEPSKIAMMTGDGGSVIKQSITQDEDKFFYCFALNKRNAIRHYNDWRNKVQNYLQKYEEAIAYLTRYHPGVSSEKLREVVNKFGGVQLYMLNSVTFFKKIAEILNA